MSVSIKRNEQNGMIVLGNDEVRIEQGPVLKTAKATEELLHDDNTASHYFTGTRPETHYDEAGNPYEVEKVGVDALGKPITLGEKMTFLAWGGKTTPAEKCFYVYRKTAIDPTVKVLNGDFNPHYVPEDVRNGSLEQDNGSPPNRTHYTYKFEEAGTCATEEEAIELGKSLLSKGSD